MLDSKEPNGNEDKQNQEKLSVSQRSFSHEDTGSPYLDDLIRLLNSVPLDVLKFELMTFQQRLFANSWYDLFKKDEPNNKNLFRECCIYVIKLDHLSQWKKAKEQGKVP